MKIESILWLLPVVFMIHDFEEIVMMKPWLMKNGRTLRRRFPRLTDYLLPGLENMTTSGFALAVAEEFLLLSVLTFIAVEFAVYNLWTGLLLAFFAHLLVHMVQFLLYRRYVPVIVTSLPAILYCLVAALALDGRRLIDWDAAIWWGIGCSVLVVGNLFFALNLGRRFDSWAARWQSETRV